MSESNLLLWIRNTGDEDYKPSTHSYISPKTEVKDDNEWGRGICASDQIRNNELLIRIPPSFLLNYTSVMRHITSANSEIKLVEPHYTKIYVPSPNPESSDSFTKLYSTFLVEELLSLSSFQLLSLYLTCEMQRKSKSFWEPFLDMLPPMSDFDLVPLVWHVLQVPEHLKLIDLLPPSTREHTNKIIKRFEGDYQVVNELVKGRKEDSVVELPLSLFLWSWMCINSRCLYMDMPQMKSNADNFTMAPYVDFLNHSSDDQCSLKIDNIGFQVYAGQLYKPGEQLFLSYGPHSNEFLLSEYGFMLNENKWNDLNITLAIESLFNPKQRQYLEDLNYLGDYTVNIESGPSFRTEVALATLQENSPAASRKLQALVNGVTDGSVYEANSKILLSEILQQIVNENSSKIVKIDTIDKQDRTTILRKKVLIKLYEDIKQISNKYI